MPIPDSITDQIAANINAGQNTFTQNDGESAWAAFWTPSQDNQEFAIDRNWSCICEGNGANTNQLYRAKFSSTLNGSYEVVLAKICSSKGPFAPNCDLVESCYNHGIMLLENTLTGRPSKSIQELWLSGGNGSPRFMVGQPFNPPMEEIQPGWWAGALTPEMSNRWLPRIAALEFGPIDDDSFRVLSTMEYLLFQELGRPWFFSPWMRVLFAWTNRGQWLLIYFLVRRAVRRRKNCKSQ